MIPQWIGTVAVWLWAVGVVAFLVLFFRGRLRWFFLWLATLLTIITSAFLQGPLLEHEGYRRLVVTASAAGRAILIFAVIVLIVDLVAMTIYTFRHGRSDHSKGRVIRENRPLSGMSSGYPSPTGWSIRRSLDGKRETITMASLVDGTATFGERMMARGIVALFVSFSLVWVGIGLVLMKTLLIFVLIPIPIGLWVYYILRGAWGDYRQAKAVLTTRRRETGGAAGSGSSQQS